jgi:hypothetical protein
VIPALGPAAANAGEQIGQGDIAGGLGAAAGLIGGATVLPRATTAAVGKVKDAAGRARGALANRNPAEVEAIEAGRRAGVPIDAATATGNRAVGAVQHMADRSLGGSLIAEKAAEAQARGLATMGEQLAAKGYGSAVTPEQAGQAVRGAVRGEIRRHAGEADAAYGKLREIEADPSNLREIEPKPGTSAAAMGQEVPAPGRRFAKPDASADDLWQGVLGDARRNGFKGSADDLKVEFGERLRSARSLGEEMASASGEVSGKALLDEIRRLGGLRPFTKEIVGQTTRKSKGDFASIVESFGARSGWSQRGGASIFRNDGLAFDDLIQQLGEHPTWKNIIQNERDLFEALDDIARQGPAAAGAADAEHLLRATGVQPGAKWWEGSPAAKVETMALPVDLRQVKESLGPLYQSLRREAELTPLMGDKGRALVALDRLVGGPDQAPLSTVDAALGELKAFARADVPELRSAGQGAAAQAIKQLDDWVQLTAENAGPEALEALQRGRASTVAKYQAAGAFESLSEEGVRSFRALTAHKDSGIGHLREIAKQAPAELPKIGRAVLDDLLGKATAEGGFKHGAAIASEWQKLGLETKRLLYQDPTYIKDLDNFFHLARLTAKNANPSGTAHAMAAASQGGAALGALTGVIDPITAVAALAGPAAISAFMHSPAGVRLLARGYKVPLRNQSARAAWAAEVSALAGQLEATNPSGYQAQPAGAR